MRHDSPHDTEPHGTAHTLYRVLFIAIKTRPQTEPKYKIKVNQRN